MSQKCEGCNHYKDDIGWPDYLCNECKKKTPIILEVLWETLMHHNMNQAEALFKQAVINVMEEIKQEENMND